MIAVISRDGLMLGLFTSQVDAWKVAKPVGASMWRCAPNSDVCEKIESTEGQTGGQAGVPASSLEWSQDCV